MADENVTGTGMKERAETEKRRRQENKTIVTVPGRGLTDGQIKNRGGYERQKNLP